MVKANVDKIIDVLREKKTSSASEISKLTNLNKNDIIKSAEYLEQDGVVVIKHKFPKVMITLIKEPSENLTEASLPMPPPPMVQDSTNHEKIDIPSTPVQNSIPTAPEQNTLPSPPVMDMSQQQNITQANLPPPPPVENIQTQSIAQTDMLSSSIDPMPQSTNNVDSTSGFPSQPLFNEPIPNNQINQDFQSIQESVNLIPDSVDTSQEFSETENLNLDVTQDPLEQKNPSFNLAAPSPSGLNQPVYTYSEEYTSTPKVTSFPEFINTDTEKIDYTIEKINERIVKHQFLDMNMEYRRLYELFKTSNTLSVNERYILSEKINEVFERIKEVYLIENAI